VETLEFLNATRVFFVEHEREALVNYLAHNPLAGDLIPGTGGVRKLRWALKGRGKRGGARIIYFYHSENLPLFLLSGYAKNTRADLSQADRNDYKRLTKLLIESYGKAKQ
jgi:hypothetical protein